MTAKTENSRLLPSGDGAVPASISVEGDSASAVSRLLLAFQLILTVLFYTGTVYSENGYQTKEYLVFRDILAMLLIGFGFLMTFLKNYGLGAVGFTMILAALSMQANVMIELAFRFLYNDESEDTQWPMPITMAILIDAEFSAAALLITFGALIGRASPLQMMVVALAEGVFYACNKVIFVLGFVGAEDVGGTMTIHLFGSCFGLAVSYALGPAKDANEPAADRVSDVFALVGTTVLWMFWPSFVGATETGTVLYEYRCVMHTILALLGSTVATFYMSHKLCHGKFDPVHIANSTLAGGVAIGSSARLEIGPGAALLLGVMAGAVSVVGYVYSSPYLERKFKIQDTCGVGNLHGWPSIVGGLASIFFVAMDPSAVFLSYDMVSQMIRQLLGVIATLAVASFSGFLTGTLVKPLKLDSAESYKDDMWWHAEYFEEETADAKEA
jgi:ammonium transporter Rh